MLCLDLVKAEELRGRMLTAEHADGAAGRARALGDPTRLVIAAAMRDGDELCVCDLSWIVARSQNLVSHHVRQLRDAGLASSRRDGKLVMYSMTDVGRAMLRVTLEALELPA